MLSLAKIYKKCKCAIRNIDNNNSVACDNKNRKLLTGLNILAFLGAVEKNNIRER